MSSNTIAESDRVSDDNAFKNLIEEAEKIIAENRRRRTNNRTETNNEEQQQELRNIRNELDNFFAPTPLPLNDNISDIEQPDSSTSIESISLSTSLSLPSMTTENSTGNDDDVLLISDISNPCIPIVDLCTPNYQNRQRRRRPLANSDDIIEIDDYSPLNKTQVELESPKAKKCLLSPTNNSIDNSTNMIICPICLESTVNRQPKSTKCGHVYCSECIKNSLQVSKKCPICKRQCTEKQLISLYL